MYTLDSYLPEHEARAERAFRHAYCAEYTRLYRPGYSEDQERLVYWSELALRAGKTARERVLAEALQDSKQPHPIVVEAVTELPITEETGC